jgi:hypothetical protein
MGEGGELPFSQRYFAGLIAIVGVLMVVCAAAAIGAPAGTADSSDFVVGAAMRPEPQEGRAYVALLLCLIPLAVATSSVVLRWRPQRRWMRLGAGPWRWFLVIVLAGTAALLLLSKSAEILFGPGFATKPWVGGLFLALYVGLVRGMFGWNRPRDLYSFAWLVLALLILSASRVLVLGQIDGSSAFTDHLNAVLFPVAHAVAGGVCGVDYVPQYGCFADFIAPLIAVLGPSLHVVSHVFFILCAVVVASVVWVIHRNVRHTWIAWVAFACLFLWLTFGRLQHPWIDPYFQYNPVRMLAPAIGLYLADRWVRTHRAVHFIALSVLSGVALVWNVESGAALAFAWGGTLVVHVTLRRLPPRTLLAGCTWAGLGLGLGVLWLWVRAGAAPSLGTLFYYHHTFGKLGYFMLPLPPLPHPFVLALLLPIAAVFLSVLLLRRGPVCATDAFVLFVALIGLGNLAYYVGRSHENNLVTVTWAHIPLAALLADRLVSMQRRRSLPGRAAVAFVLLFGVLCGNRLLEGIPSFGEDYLAQVQRAEERSWLTDTLFFSGRTIPRPEALALITPHESILALELGRAPFDRLPVGQLARFSEGRDLVGRLGRAAPANLLVEPASGAPATWPPLREPLMQLVRERYQLKRRYPNGLLHYVLYDKAPVQ